MYEEEKKKNKRKEWEGVERISVAGDTQTIVKANKTTNITTFLGS